MVGCQHDLEIRFEVCDKLRKPCPIGGVRNAVAQLDQNPDAGHEDLAENGNVSSRPGNCRLRIHIGSETVARPRQQRRTLLAQGHSQFRFQPLLHLCVRRVHFFGREGSLRAAIRE